MNKAHFRIFIFVIACILAISCILYYLPWPSYIHMELNGAMVTSEGAVTPAGPIVVKGWKLDYLFQKDKLALDMDLPAAFGWRFEPYDNGPTTRIDHVLGTPYMIASCAYLDLQEAAFDFGYFALNTQDGLVILYCGDANAYLVGAVDDTYDPAQALDYFSEFVRIWDIEKE